MILTHAQTVHVYQAVCLPSLRPEIEATVLFDVSDVLFCILLCTRNHEVPNSSMVRTSCKGFSPLVLGPVAMQRSIEYSRTLFAYSYKQECMNQSMQLTVLCTF